MEPGDIPSAGQRMSVSLAGSAFSLSGLPLSDWVTIATLIYVVFQLIVITPAVIKTVKGWFNRG